MTAPETRCFLFLPFCPTPLIGSGAQKPKPEPVKVVATPYVWRDPTTIKPREWVYGRSIQRGHVRAILAPGAAGKTILSVGEALAMATGRNLLGQEVPGGPKRVWLWNLEDDAEELSRIIQAACKHWSIGPEHIRDHLFVDSALEGAILKLATSTAAEGLVINRPLVAGLTDELLSRGVDYLHADPFVSSHSANENDNMEIDSIAKEWAMVAKNAKCGIGLAHHVSKAGAAEVTALSGRGAVALINACRSVLVLNRMGEEEARMWGIEEERRRRFFRVYDDKNNRAPPTSSGEVKTGGEGGGPNRPHPTCPPIGAGVGKGGPRVEYEGEENPSGEAEAAPRTPTVFPAGNPALRPILAPGQTGSEPIPGYEDFGNE